jgi:hypothetical protein
MTISVAIRLNGNAVGAKLSVAAGGTITATLDSVAGVDTVAWEVIGTDETSSAEDLTTALVQSGIKGETVTFDALGVGTAGVLKATANGNPLLFATVKWFVPAVNGLEVGAANEERESDPTFGTTGVVNAAIRGASAVNGAVGASYFFDSAASPVAASGLFRVGVGPVVVIAGRATTGASTRAFLSWDDGTIHFGSAADFLDLDALTSASFGAAGARHLTATTGGLALFNSAANLQGGAKIIFIGECTTPPAAAPSGGIFGWVDSTQALCAEGPRGITVTLVPQAPASGLVPRRTDVCAGLSTASNAATTILSITLPAGSIATIPYRVSVRDLSGHRSFFQGVIRAGRNGAGVAIVDDAPASPADKISGSFAAALSVTTDGANVVRIDVVGDPLATLTWVADWQPVVWS